MSASLENTYSVCSSASVSTISVLSSTNPASIASASSDFVP